MTKKWIIRVVHYCNLTYVTNCLAVNEFLFGQQSRAVLVGGVDDFLYFFPCDIYAVRRVNAVDFFHAQASIPVLVSLAERFCQLLALLTIPNPLLVEQYYGRHSDRGVHKSREEEKRKGLKTGVLRAKGEERKPKESRAQLELRGHTMSTLKP